MAFDPNDPETKAALSAAVEEATKGLISKRDELLSEVKKLRKNAEIDPDEFQRLKEEKDALADKLAEQSKAAKNALSEAEKATKQLQKEGDFVSKLLVDNGLNDALTKAGVKPELAKAVKAMFAGQAQIKADGETRAAMIGDKSISDFVTEWAKSDEGKHFIAAPANSGGGANGGNGSNQTAKTMTRADYSARTQAGDTSLAKFFADGGQLVE